MAQVTNTAPKAQPFVSLYVIVPFVVAAQPHHTPQVYFDILNAAYINLRKQLIYRLLQVWKERGWIQRTEAGFFWIPTPMGLVKMEDTFKFFPDLAQNWLRSIGFKPISQVSATDAQNRLHVAPPPPAPILSDIVNLMHKQEREQEYTTPTTTNTTTVQGAPELDLDDSDQELSKPTIIPGFNDLP